jgi:hypothetical protein
LHTSFSLRLWYRFRNYICTILKKQAKNNKKCKIITPVLATASRKFSTVFNNRTTTGFYPGQPHYTSFTGEKRTIKEGTQRKAEWLGFPGGWLELLPEPGKPVQELSKSFKEFSKSFGEVSKSFKEVSKSLREVSKPSRERAQSSKEGLFEALRGF